VGGNMPPRPPRLRRACMKIKIMGGKITENLGFKIFNMFYLINELKKILKSG
jgi:hypothetical protein